MTRTGFPHSEIPVSSLACQLDGAYRRLLRPSSPPDAKASTACPSQLDPILGISSTRCPNARANWLLRLPPPPCRLSKRERGRSPVAERLAAVSIGSRWRPARRPLAFLLKGGDPAAGSPTATLLRLHPNHRTDRWHLLPLRVRSVTSGPSNFRGVTGGVYKARERIHRGMLIRDY